MSSTTTAAVFAGVASIVELEPNKEDGSGQRKMWDYFFAPTLTHRGTISSGSITLKPAPIPNSREHSEFLDTIGNEFTYFEDTYEKPEGFVSLHRRLYDAQNNTEVALIGTINKMLPQAKTLSKMEQEDTIKLLRSMRHKIGKVIDSVLSFFYDTEIKKLSLPYNGANATKVAEAYHLYRNNPTIDLLEKMWLLFWTKCDNKQTLNRMEYAVLHRCKIWFIRDHSVLNRTPSHKTCRSFIISLIKYKVQNNYRKEFQREGVLHGIKLRLSKPYKTKGAVPTESKRTKPKLVGKFDATRHITGWREAKHQLWMEQKEAPIEAACITPPSSQQEAPIEAACITPPSSQHTGENTVEEEAQIEAACVDYACKMTPVSYTGENNEENNDKMDSSMGGLMVVDDGNAANGASLSLHERENMDPLQDTEGRAASLSHLPNSMDLSELLETPATSFRPQRKRKPVPLPLHKNVSAGAAPRVGGEFDGRQLALELQKLQAKKKQLEQKVREEKRETTAAYKLMTNNDNEKSDADRAAAAAASKQIVAIAKRKENKKRKAAVTTNQSKNKKKAKKGSEKQSRKAGGNKKLKKYEDADDQEYLVTKVYGETYYGDEDGWWLKVDLKSRTGEFEDSIGNYSELKYVYNNCGYQVQEKDDGEEENTIIPYAEENLVIAYAQDQRDKLDPSLAAAIAACTEETVKKLFPDCKTESKQKDSSTCAPCCDSNDNGNTNKENAAPPMKADNTKATAVLKVSVSNEKKKLECKCVHDDYTIGPYTAVPSSYYWEEGRKYHGKSCYINKCKKAIPKPCERTPLYVCAQFALNKGDNCGCVICHECFGKELVKAATRPSRKRG